jgi:thiol-disulfide isomerase/thioredoxin
MNRNVLLVAILMSITIQVALSEELTLYFQNLYRLPREQSENTSPLYFLNFDTLRVSIDTISSHDIFVPVKLPDMKHSSDTTFFKEYFTGWENSVFGRETMFLVGNYKSDTTYIWADLNNNLDFTDDNAFFMITKENPYIYVALTNSKNPEGKFLYKLGKKHYEDTTLKNEIREHFYNDDKKQGFITTDCNYWLGVTRLSILSCDTVIEGEKIQIGLMDWNCNGLFNDIDTVSPDNFHSDRILTGIYGNKIISDRLSAGAVVILPETLIPINGKIYSLIEVVPSGRYIKIKKTDRTYQLLKKGDPLPDLEFTLFNREKTSLRKQIVSGKYNLIDIWGFWCKGCMLAIPKLKKLDSLYSDKLNIIGLHDSQSNAQYAFKTVKQYDIKWKVGFLTSEIEKKLLSSGGFPYYVLVDREGKIAEFDPTLKEVEELLKKSTN